VTIKPIANAAMVAANHETPSSADTTRAPGEDGGRACRAPLPGAGSCSAMSLIMTYCRADGPGAAVDSGGAAVGPAGRRQSAAGREPLSPSHRNRPVAQVPNLTPYAAVRGGSASPASSGQPYNCRDQSRPGRHSPARRRIEGESTFRPVTPASDTESAGRLLREDGGRATVTVGGVVLAACQEARRNNSALDDGARYPPIRRRHGRLSGKCAAEPNRLICACRAVSACEQRAHPRSAGWIRPPARRIPLRLGGRPRPAAGARRERAA
jgi:hypothetical protein